MRLSDLETFVEICRCRSIRKAGEALGLSQPGITKLVKRLEHELGAPLLQRLPRGVEPTTYGRTLEAHAKFAVVEIGNAKARIRGISQGDQGSIRIGASTAVAYILLPAIAERIRSAIPDTDIHVIEDTIDKLATGLRSGDYDVVIAPAPRVGMDREIETQHLIDDELVLIGREGHPARERSDCKLSSLLGHPWIFIGEDPYKESYIIPLLAQRKLPMPKWIIETNSTGFMVNYLLRSDCVALQSQLLATQFEGSGISAFRTQEKLVPWPIMISFRKRTVMTPLLERVIAEAIEVTRAQQGRWSS